MLGKFPNNRDVLKLKWSSMLFLYDKNFIFSFLSSIGSDKHEVEQAIFSLYNLSNGNI